MKYEQIDQTKMEGKLYCVAITMLLGQPEFKTETPQTMHDKIEALSKKLYRTGGQDRFEQAGRAI